MDASDEDAVGPPCRLTRPRVALHAANPQRARPARVDACSVGLALFCVPAELLAGDATGAVLGEQADLAAADRLTARLRRHELGGVQRPPSQLDD